MDSMDSTTKLREGCINSVDRGTYQHGRCSYTEVGIERAGFAETSTAGFAVVALVSGLPLAPSVM